MKALVLIGCLFPAVATPAQQDPESAFVASAVRELNDFAGKAFKNGYPTKAKEIWLEIIGAYDSNDEAARKALGFVRVGAVWTRDGKTVLPEENDPNPAVARMLQKRWDKVAKSVGKGHRNLAQKLQEAGSVDRARYHFERALRFLGADEAVHKALGLEEFEGLRASKQEVSILRRSKLMDSSLERVTAIEPPVVVLPASAGHGALAGAGIEYRGVKSDHFTMWGDWSEEVLIDAAQHAERALQWCNEVFEGYEGYPASTGVISQFALFREKPTWIKVIRKNGGQFGERLEFTIRETSGAVFQVAGGRMATCGMATQVLVRDYVVRRVAESFTGFERDALQEGIGHAVVGHFFRRNLIFTVAPDTRKTVAFDPNAEKYTLPDLDVWIELAVQSAWEKTSTPAAKLPLIRASDFPNEARIKAWSMCDYLVRRDPRLIRHLDRSGSSSRVTRDVEAAFQKIAGMDLGSLEDEWRRFWIGETVSGRERQRDLDLLGMASKGGPKWLAGFNAVRAAEGRDPVKWSAALTADCRAHGDYLRRNRRLRRVADLYTEDPDKEGFTIQGRQLAPRTLVSTSRGKAKKLAAEWIHVPGFRDAVLNNRLMLVGIHADKNVAVFEVRRGIAADEQLMIASFPRADTHGTKNPVPDRIDSALLGPDFPRLLAKAGIAEVPEQVGYPLTMHFFAARPGPREALFCRVTIQGKPVQGLLVLPEEPMLPPMRAPGMVAFYPLEPLGRGQLVEVVWNFKSPDGPEGPLVTQFMTR